MLLLEIKNLKFKYNKNLNRETVALENINFKLSSGDFLGLIGKNGSGKSTLIKLLSGLIKPTKGKILINKEDIFKFLKKDIKNRFKVGAVFQFPEDQIFMETVYDDIAFGLKNMNINAKEIQKRIYESLEFVNLGKFFSFKSTNNLSFGEKRKVAIAGIIALRPKILILDEPTSGLDFESKENILKNVKRYCENNKAIVILVSHNIEDVIKYTNKVLLLENGKVDFFGLTKDFLKFKNLKKIKEMLPSYTRVLLKLKESGYKINEENILDIDLAADEVAKLFLKRQKDF